MKLVKTSSNSKKKRNRKKKKRKREENDATNVDLASSRKKINPLQNITKKTRKGIPFHPFKSDFGDHFSTSNVALRDFVPVLRALSENRRPLRVYDPFYCDGSVKVRLKELGFPNVIHENRDFYKDMKKSLIPDHDVLVTNPPYSGTHKIRILDYVLKRNSKRPFALLLPNYVVSKQWYKDAIQEHIPQISNRPFFVVPKMKYEYEHPTGKGHESSPFDSLWIVCAWDQTQAIYKKSKSLIERTGNASVFKTPQDLDKGSIVKLNRKRPNPRARRKARKMKKK